MGWVANILILIGMYLLGEHNRHAFLFSIAGEAIWGVMGALMGRWDLALICGIFCLGTFRNWLKWGADEKLQRPPRS